MRSSVPPRYTEGVLELEFFTPKALHNLAQGITLGLSLLFIPTLKALNKPPNNDILKPFQGGPSLFTFPGVLRRAKLSHAFGVSDGSDEFSYILYRVVILTSWHHSLY